MKGEIRRSVIKIGDIVANCLIISFGIILMYVFVTIEIQHSFGQEPNRWLRYFEVFMGLPIMVFGIKRLVSSIPKKVKETNKSVAGKIAR